MGKFTGWLLVADFDDTLRPEGAAGPIPALTHTPDEAHEENRVEPNCTDAGQSIHLCAALGDN